MKYTSNATEKFDPMMSLYEYLGKAAGSELGKKVADAAKIAKVSIATREVSNAKYTGAIMIYPKSFLDSYFKVLPSNTNNSDEELPF
jgi:hypothetical protein